MPRPRTVPPTNSSSVCCRSPHSRCLGMRERPNLHNDVSLLPTAPPTLPEQHRCRKAGRTFQNSKNGVAYKEGPNGNTNHRRYGSPQSKNNIYSSASGNNRKKCEMFAGMYKNQPIIYVPTAYLQVHRLIVFVYYKICATSSMKTPSQAVSVNVMTLKSGFTSAIFFNHSMHAPHGFKGLMQFRSAGTRATTPPAGVPTPPPSPPPPPRAFWPVPPGVLVAVSASASVAVLKSRRVEKMLRTTFVRRSPWESLGNVPR